MSLVLDTLPDRNNLDRNVAKIAGADLNYMEVVKYLPGSDDKIVIPVIDQADGEANGIGFIGSNQRGVDKDMHVTVWLFINSNIGGVSTVVDTNDFAVLSGPNDEILTVPGGKTYDLTDTDTFADVNGAIITDPEGDTLDINAAIAAADKFSSLSGSVITFEDNQQVTIVDQATFALLQSQVTSNDTDIANLQNQVNALARDAVFIPAGTTNNANTLDISGLISTNPIDIGGSWTGHSRLNFEATIDNGGAAYSTVIDGVLTTGVTAPTIVDAGSEWRISRINSTGYVLSFSTTTSGSSGVEGIPGNDVNALTSPRTINLPDSNENLGEGFTISDATNAVDFASITGEDITGDIDHTEEGSVLITLPSTKKILGGLNIIASQPNDAANTVDWVVSSNITLRRGPTGGLYNIAAGQASWSGNNATGTLWRNDTNTTPTTFSSVFDGQIGDFILDPAYDNVYITDVNAGTEFGPFTFTAWQQGGGGGFAVSDQSFEPSTFEKSWEVIDPRPEVRTANTTTNRNRPPQAVTTIVNQSGGAAPGGAQTSSLTIGKFISASGGQSNHGDGLDQTFNMATQLMSRINVRSFTDVTNSAEMRLTITGPFGASQTATQTVGSANDSVNFDFNAQEVNEVRLEILTGFWRARGFTHSLGAPTVANPNNTFATGGYAGSHNALHLINPSDFIMFVDGIEGKPEYVVYPESSETITREFKGGPWHAADQLDPDARSPQYRWVSILGDWTLSDFDAQSAEGYTTVTVSNSISGTGGVPRTIEYGSASNPQTLSLEDGEHATFVFNAVSGWTPINGSESTNSKNALSYGVMTSDDNDPVTGHNVTWDETHTVRPGAFISGASITLAQSPEPYELTAAIGFDFDGTPDDALILEFVETSGAVPLISNSAEAKTFDTTADGVTFSKFEYIRLEAFAVFDASAGPLVVNLRVTDGATGVDITESRLKVAQP